MGAVVGNDNRRLQAAVDYVDLGKVSLEFDWQNVAGGTPFICQAGSRFAALVGLTTMV